MVLLRRIPYFPSVKYESVEAYISITHNPQTRTQTWSEGQKLSWLGSIEHDPALSCVSNDTKIAEHRIKHGVKIDHFTKYRPQM